MPLRFAAFTGGLLLLALTFACNKSDQAPSSSKSPPPPVALAVNSVSPATVWANYPQPVRVIGLGFLSGASVTIGDTAVSITSFGTTTITVTTPVRGVGTADIVVTNPDGKSGTLPGGLTFQTVTLAANPSVVSPGASVTVAWVAASQLVGGDDWVALFAVGQPNELYTEGLWKYVSGNPAGNATFTAPMQPGEYEFRYLPDDGYVDVARTAVSVR